MGVNAADTHVIDRLVQWHAGASRIGSTDLRARILGGSGGLILLPNLLRLNFGIIYLVMISPDC